MDLMVKNLDLASKDMLNKLMIFGSNRKNLWNAAVWRKKVMLEKNKGLRHRERGGYK